MKQLKMDAAVGRQETMEHNKVNQSDGGSEGEMQKENENSENSDGDALLDEATPLSPSNIDMEAVKTAIKGGSDVATIRSLCNGQAIPAEIRRHFWKECLGVSKKQDAIGDWNGPLDVELQEVIHGDCQQIAATLESEPCGGIVVPAALMETIITFYCKSRNTKYPGDGGYAEVLLPLIKTGMTKTDIYNCFYTILNRYIPRDCRPGTPPYHLFRLLLLYHDPGLCSYLDTHKLTPDEYLQPWIRSLFVSSCKHDVIAGLWDVYFSERDPFLVFFLALVMIINAKEVLMESPDMSPKQMKELLSSLPDHVSADDIEDFCSLAQYYSNRTPQSFRKDFHTLLFGMSRGPTFVPLSHALCLPVSLGEVLESLNQDGTIGIKYYIVDSRPISHFSKGHLPGSFHLDANLFLHSPKDFMVAANRVCERIKSQNQDGGEHLCFLSTGRENEDQYVNMVVAKFLQNSVPFVSVAQGGFVELLELLGDRAPKILEDYDEHCKQILTSEEDDINHSSSASREQTPHRSHSDSDSDTGQLKTASSWGIQQGARLYTSLASGMKEKSSRLTQQLKKFVYERQKPERHVSSSDKKGKRYRNHPNVFSIADEDDDNELEDNSLSSEDEGLNKMVSIEAFLKGDEVIASFPSNELREGGFTSPSYLVLTKNKLIILRECTDRTGWARVKFSHPLRSIMKITMKKRQPDVITFKYGSTMGDDVHLTGQQKFQIPQTSKATTAIKNQIEKIVSQPNS